MDNELDIIMQAVMTLKELSDTNKQERDKIAEISINLQALIALYANRDNEPRV